MSGGPERLMLCFCSRFVVDLDEFAEKPQHGISDSKRLIFSPNESQLLAEVIVVFHCENKSMERQSGLKVHKPMLEILVRTRMPRTRIVELGFDDTSISHAMVLDLARRRLRRADWRSKVSFSWW